MYNVVYLDQTGRKSVIGADLEREQACELALRESQRRGVGRMFLAGSEQIAAPTAQVLIVDSHGQAA